MKVVEGRLKGKRVFSIKVFVFLGFALFACSQPTKEIRIELPQPTVESGRSEMPTVPDGVIIRLDMERGEAFSSSSTYTVSIYSDGKMVFDGKENVRKIGISKSEIRKSELAELIIQFDDSDFFQFSDRFTREENCSFTILSDSPMIKVYYNNGKSAKTVVHYAGCESPVGNLGKLIMLEKSVDELISSKHWIE